MPTPHRYAALIKAWADGAQIQYRNPDWPAGRWEDTVPGWYENYEYRVKPANNEYFVPLGKVSSGLFIGLPASTKECATKSFGYGTAKILHLEINPATLELVSATMEAP